MIKVNKYTDQFGIQILLDFEDGKKMNIYYGGNLDLYFMPYSENKKDTYLFEINQKDNYDLYNIFNNMFNSVIEYKAIDGKVDKRFKKEEKYRKHPLVKDKMITWISDEAPEDVASSVNIFKQGNNICLFFNQGKDQLGMTATSVRFSTSGSRYDSFFVPFMDLYRNICATDFECHQITMDEYLLSLKERKTN